MEDYSYYGVGKIYLRVKDSAAALLFIGNCSALSFAIAEETKTQPDFTVQGGGVYNEVSRISSVEATYTAYNFSPDNIARAIFGETSAIAAGAVTAESVVGYKGGLALLDYQLNDTIAPVVEAANGNAAAARANTTAVSLNAYLVPAAANTYFYKVTTAGTTAAAPPTFPIVAGATVTDGTAVLTCMGKIILEADTDYTLSGSGIVFDEAARITDGESFEVDYTKLAGNVIEALTTGSQEYELVFEGLNEARSGKPVTVQVYRLKLKPSQALPLIGDDFATLEMTGKLLVDTSKTGAGISQYFKTKLAA